MQNAGDADEQGGSGDHANGVQRSGSGPARNAPKGGRGRPVRGRGQMRGDMGMGGPMAPMGTGMMGGMQAMPGQMFVLAPGKPNNAECMSVAFSSFSSSPGVIAQTCQSINKWFAYDDDAAVYLCLPVCSQGSTCTLQALSNSGNHALPDSGGLCSVHLLSCFDTVHQPELTCGFCLSALAIVSWPCGSACAHIL